MKKYLLVFSIILLTSCSSFSNAYYGRAKDDPRDFKEKRDPRDNQYIASGGLKKKTVIIEPGEGRVAADQNKPFQSKSAIQQNDGFSQKMLNISKHN